MSIEMTPADNLFHRVRLAAAKMVYAEAMSGRQKFTLTIMAEAAKVLLTDREWIEEQKHG